MTGVFVYLLETSVCLGITLLIYRFVLSGLTFFAWNRAILLVLLGLSFTIPLMSFDFFEIGGGEVVREITLPVVQVGEQIATVQTNWALYLEILFGIYLLGVVVTASRMIFGLMVSQRLIGKAKKLNHEDHLIAIHPEFVPASFFGYILMPDYNPESPEQRQIILHESIHVRLHHSWDLLLVNFGKIIFWFNPLIYLFEKSLREVHEFQADQGVTRSVSPREYATLLLQLITAKPGWQFMNNFNQFQTKKRIIMLGKSQSAHWQKLRFLTMIPLVGVLIFVFSCENEEINPQLASLVESPEVMETPLTVENIQVVPYDSPAESSQVPEETLLDPDEVFDVVEQQPNPQGGMSGWNMYLSKNIQYPQKAREMGVEGTVIVVFEIHTDGSIHNVEILRGIGGGADEEAVRVVQNAPKWEPGRQRGRAVKTRMRLPIRFKMASTDNSNSEITKLFEDKIQVSQSALKEIMVVGYSSVKKN